MSPSRRSSSSPPNTRSCPRSIDEVEALTLERLRARPAQARRHVRRPQAPQGIKNTNVALDYRLRRGDFDKAYAARRAQVRARVPHPEGAAPVVRAVRLHRGLQGHRRHAPQLPSQGPSFVRTEIARLLGWPENKRAHQGAVSRRGYGSKLYIKLEALALALSMIARRAREGRAHLGGDVLPDHQASLARSASRAASTRTAGSSRASARCSGTAAPMPTSVRASRRRRA